MEDLVTVNGIVLKHSPSGDYDWVVTIFTAERGKITAFARGARKPGNKLCGCVEPFCFGSFKLFASRTAYNIQEASIDNYFEGFRTDLEAACYGTFFLELASYYTRENNEDRDLLNLLYISLKALLKESLANALVRCIYELKALEIEGEYPGVPEGAELTLSESARYTLEYIEKSPINKLYTFSVNDEVLKELSLVTSLYRNRYIDKKLNSLEMLSAFDSQL